MTTLFYKSKIDVSINQVTVLDGNKKDSVTVIPIQFTYVRTEIGQTG